MLIDDHLLIEYGAQLMMLKMGDIIFKEGGISRHYYQVKSGSVKWMNRLETGDEFIQMMIYPGDCFGEVALFDQMPYSANAVAQENCEIWALEHHHFKRLLEEHPEIQAKLILHFAERVRYKFISNKVLAFINAELRITNLIEYFKSNCTNIDCSTGKLLLTRQELADMAALRVETVIRTLRKMKEMGKIRIENGKVYI